MLIPLALGVISVLMILVIIFLLIILYALYKSYQESELLINDICKIEDNLTAINECPEKIEDYLGEDYAANANQN